MPIAFVLRTLVALPPAPAEVAGMLVSMVLAFMLLTDFQY
jgi:putative flippase GtrA